MLNEQKFNRIFRNEDVKIFKNFKLRSKLSNAENYSPKYLIQFSWEALEVYRFSKISKTVILEFLNCILCQDFFVNFFDRCIFRKKKLQIYIIERKFVKNHFGDKIYIYRKIWRKVEKFECKIGKFDEKRCIFKWFLIELFSFISHILHLAKFRCLNCNSVS